MTEVVQLRRSAVMVIDNLVTNRQIKVVDLRITFAIKKNGQADGNSSTISIYNLSESSRGHCQTETTKEKQNQTHIELRVGYGIETRTVIFRGLAEVTSTWKAPNWVTTFLVTDGVKEMKTAQFEKTYRAGTPIFLIVKDMIEASGLNIQVNQSLLTILPKSRTFTGSVKANIEDLSATFGFTFDIQDEEAIVKSIPQVVLPSSIIVLGINTGLLGKPHLKGDVLIINCLINTALRPNSYVALSTSVPGLEGVHLIKNVSVSGDTWSGPWTMVLECQSPQKNPMIIL